MLLIMLQLGKDMKTLGAKGSAVLNSSRGGVDRALHVILAFG